MKTLSKALAAAILISGLIFTSCDKDELPPLNGNNDIEIPGGNGNDSNNDNGNDSNSGNTGGNTGGGLWTAVPDFNNANYQDKSNCGNGEHKYYTTNRDYSEVVNTYAKKLKSAGWDVVHASSGGSAWGGGGQVAAYHGKRYLKMHVGGSQGYNNIDLCVWPEKPINDNCGNDNNND